MNREAGLEVQISTLRDHWIRPLGLIGDYEDQKNHYLLVESARAEMILSSGFIHLMSASQDHRRVPRRLHLHVSSPCVLAMLYRNQTSSVGAYSWLALHWYQRCYHHNN